MEKRRPKYFPEIIPYIKLDATEEDLVDWKARRIEQLKEMEAEAKISDRYSEFLLALKRAAKYDQFCRFIFNMTKLNVDWKENLDILEDEDIYGDLFDDDDDDISGNVDDKDNNEE